jgi:predicted DNA-binding transcriptional regulator YafY
MSTKYERIIFIDQQIRADKYPSAKTVAQVFEVSERSIWNDYQFLRDRLGSPIEYDETQEGWYYADPVFVLPAIWVEQDELLAFFLGHAIARNYLGPPFETQVLAGWEKITHYLPEKILAYLEKVERYYTIETGFSSNVPPQLLQDFDRAIRERRQVEMVYYTASRNDQRKRVVCPYHIYSATGFWYLIAFDWWRQDMRNFNLERVVDYRLLDQSFELDSTFSADTYIAQGFMGSMSQAYDFAIRFDAYQARYIRERKWHPSQTVEDLPDGGLVLRFHSGGLDAVQRWVMQYGPHAQVLEPPELRRRIQENVAKMSQLYTD